MLILTLLMMTQSAHAGAYAVDSPLGQYKECMESLKKMAGSNTSIAYDFSTGSPNMRDFQVVEQNTSSSREVGSFTIATKDGTIDSSGTGCIKKTGAKTEVRPANEVALGRIFNSYVSIAVNSMRTPGSSEEKELTIKVVGIYNSCKAAGVTFVKSDGTKEKLEDYIKAIAMKIGFPKYIFIGESSSPTAAPVTTIKAQN